MRSQTKLLLMLIIVQNIGLQAKILSQRTFTIFVVMALATTFLTTPLTTALYPPWYRKKLAAWRRGEIDWDGNLLDQFSEADGTSDEKENDIRRLLVCLRLESLPSLLAFLSLLGSKPETANRVHPSKVQQETTPLLSKRRLEVHGLRMLELTERMSSVMKNSELEDFGTKDPVVNSFQSFGQMNNLGVSGDVEIVPEDSYAEILMRSASQQASDMVFLPWSESGTLSETPSAFEHSRQQMLENGAHSHFVAKFLRNAPCHTAIFVNKGFGGAPATREHEGLIRTKSGISLRSNHGLPATSIVDPSHHIFLPFFGGADDRIALRFVLRLAHNINITATILCVDVDQASISAEVEEPTTSPRKGGVKVTASSSQETFFEQEKGFFISMKDSLPHELESRVVFDVVNTTQPLKDTIERVKSEVGQSKNSGDLLVCGRGWESRVNVRTELHHLLATAGMTGSIGSEAGQSLGDFAQACLATEVKASLLIIQAKKEDIIS